MKLTATATLLLLGASTWAQQAPVKTPNPATAKIENYSLKANSFIEALLKISAQFHLPVGVEWIKTADTLKPVKFSRSRTTVADIIDSLVAMHAGYEWRTEDGVIHVFRRDLVKDSRNPLNITISSFDQAPETVGWANNNLDQMVSDVVRHPEVTGIAGSVIGYPGEPVFSFASQNVSARSILNKIVTAGLASSVPGLQRVWIATFPESSVLSRTGYFETVPVWDPDAVPAQEQSFWVLLSWGHPPPEKMVK
jgi:hypothetical protein